MRLPVFTAAVLVFAIGSIAQSAAEERDVVTYYDRDGDGVVDYELHRVRNTVYLSYALIDSKYAGRYDKKMKLAYPFNTDRVDIPVPRHVKFIRGMPPYITDQRFNAPTPAP
jgi:hypothetical protein